MGSPGRMRCGRRVGGYDGIGGCASRIRDVLMRPSAKGVGMPSSVRELLRWVGLGRVKRGMTNACVRGGVALTRVLPRSVWLRIREVSGIVGRMDYDRHPIYLRTDSWIENDVRLHSCKKEPGTVEWIESWIKPGEVLYDVGACVGAYSLVACRACNEQLRLYAFEPGFVTFPQLCHNIVLNHAVGMIIPLQVALLDDSGIRPFRYQNLMTGGPCTRSGNR